MKSKIQQSIVRYREKRNSPIRQEEAIQKAKDSFMKPFVELLILFCLSQGDRCGYEIAQCIKAQSGGRLRMPEGGMYPTLHHMIGKGYITDYRPGNAGATLRICYQITPAGRERLKMLLDACQEVHTGFQACIAAAEISL